MLKFRNINAFNLSKGIPLMLVVLITLQIIFSQNSLAQVISDPDVNHVPDGIIGDFKQGYVYNDCWLLAGILAVSNNTDGGFEDFSVKLITGIIATSFKSELKRIKRIYNSDEEKITEIKKSLVMISKEKFKNGISVTMGSFRNRFLAFPKFHSGLIVEFNASTFKYVDPWDSKTIQEDSLDNLANDILVSKIVIHFGNFSQK